MRFAILLLIGAGAAWGEAETRELHSCTCDRSFLSLDKGPIGLCLRSGPEITREAQERVINGQERRYVLRTSLWSKLFRQDDAVVVHRWNYRWAEAPTQVDADRLIEWISGPVVVVDSRGHNADGSRWRRLTHPYEAVSYAGVAPELAARLDEVLDGVCLGPETVSNHFSRSLELGPPSPAPTDICRLDPMHQPTYLSVAAYSGQQGLVEAEVTINAEGRLSVIALQGHPLLKRSVESSLSEAILPPSCRGTALLRFEFVLFEQGSRDGQPRTEFRGSHTYRVQRVIPGGGY